jgi:hypothetical protein
MVIAGGGGGLGLMEMTGNHVGRTHQNLVNQVESNENLWVILGAAFYIYKCVLRKFCV